MPARNLCDGELFQEIFTLADAMVSQEQERSLLQKTHFVYKDKIRELLLLLFSLCEYNLKIMFAQKSNPKLAALEAVGTMQAKECRSPQANSIEEVIQRHMRED